LHPEQPVLQEERPRDPTVTFPVRLEAYRQVAVERVPLALVGLVRRALVVLEHRAELVHLQLAVRSAVVAVVVAQAAAAAEQTHSMR
jgi:hypothetical protein